MYRALYRKWRPVDFDDVWGQDQVTDILKYEVASGKFSHAYLFCGSRGTGKTSTAKILAKAVNCLSPQNGNPCNACAACRAIDAGTATDVMEMDAASNTSVDDVRSIRDEILFAPAELTYRVYIIDEVHMISGNAFNALLKTLEEPPSHVIFILATTELHKLPATIVSRCQRFDFRRISNEVLSRRLLYIAEKESIALTEGGARILARLAVGGMRDAISLFELCAGMKETIDEKLVSSVCGVGDRMAGYRLVEAIAARDYSAIYGTVRDIVMSSRDLTVFWRELMECYRDMMVMKTTQNAAEYLDLTDSEAEYLRPLAARFSMEQLIYHSRILEESMARMQRPGASRRATAELALTRICDPKLATGEEALLARIAELEAKFLHARSEGRTPPMSSEEKTVDATVARTSDEVSHEASATAKETATAYRAFAGWGEVLEDMTRKDPPSAGFLQGSRAAVSADGRLVVSVSTPFAVSILNRDEARERLRLTAEEIGEIPIASVEIKHISSHNETTILGELERALAECQ